MDVFLMRRSPQMNAAMRPAIVLIAMALLWTAGLAFGAGFVKDPALFDKIRPGVTTSKELTELLGPPGNVAQFPRRNVEAWDYTTLENFSKRKVNISIEIDSGSIVRNVEKITEYGP